MRREVLLFGTTILVVLYLTPQIYARQNIYSFLANVYRNDTVILLEFNVGFDEPTDFPLIDVGYKLKVTDYKSNSIFEAFLPIEFKQQIITSEGVKDIILEMVPLYLKIPYFENASRIEIFHNKTLIFAYNICDSNYICEPEKGETPVNCPNDCLPVTTTTLPSIHPTFPFYYILAIIAVIAVILFFLLTRIKVQRSEGTS
jgi:hypothetical protein